MGTPARRRKVRFAALPAEAASCAPAVWQTFTAASPTPPVPACTNTCGQPGAQLGSKWGLFVP